MKKIISILMVIVLMFSLTACGEEKIAEATVRVMFTAFKTFDLDTIMKFVNVDSQLEQFGADSDKIKDYEQHIKLMFDKFDYEILSTEKIDSQTVTVKTKITAMDMKPVLADFATSIMQYAFSNMSTVSNLSEEEMNKKVAEILLTCLEKPDLATVTKDVDVKVVKNGKTWEVQTDETLVNAILGDLEKAAEEMSSSFGN